jgi:hypothetical protein
VNHLLAFNKDVHYHRVGFDEDWRDGQGNYQCQFFQEVHGRVKAMMEADPQNVTRETRVVFVRPWSDGFEAKKVKVHHTYNNLQVFTLTLRAIRGKGTKRHTMPFGLCFKKESHAEIFMQLLKEVHALETPTKRFFGEENRFYITIVLIDMISADYPERCANAIIAQLGNFTHRWGFSCKYDDNYTPSCPECESARIQRLHGGNNNNSGDADKKCCSDWWSEGHFGVHVKADRYPIKPGAATPDKDPSVPITFEMLVNGMNDLQKWYNESVRDDMAPKEKNKLIGSAKDYLNRLGISSYLVPLLAEDMGKGIDICNSEFYQELWKKYDELNISMKQIPSILMHMTMLGVEKSLISRTKMLVNRRKPAENKIWHQLTDSMNTTLAAVEKDSLDWCMPMPFSNNDKQSMGTSKWQSDHFLSFTRLSLFHFGPLNKDIGLSAGKTIFAAFKRVRVVWFCLMSSILADEDVDAARIDDLVKLFLTSCRDWWRAAKDKLSGGEVDSSPESTRKRKAGSGAGGKAKKKKKTAREKASSKDTTKERKSDSDGAAPTKGGKKKASSKDSTKKRKSDGAAPTTGGKKKNAKKRKVAANNGTRKKAASNQQKSTENAGQEEKKKDEAPFFITGSNYLSLRNIAEMKDYFGPSLREFWESMHEKFIQYIKGELKNMRHTTEFLATILRKVLRRMMLEKLIEDNPYQQKKQYARVDNFKIYKLGKSDKEPSIVLANNTAVSGIIDAQGRMLLCVERTGERGQFALHPVLFNNDGSGFWRYNLWYSQAEIGQVSKVCTSRKEVLELAHDYFLMLRPIADDAPPCQTVICRSWRVRNQSGELALPVPDLKTLLMETE